jgi:hypothetical protein
MRKALSIMMAAAIAVTSFAAPAAVQASPLKSVSGVNESSVQDVQYYHGRRGGYYGRHYGHRRGYYRHRRSNGGAAVAAGVVGLAAGVIAGQALAQPRYVTPAPAYGDRHAYCYSRYRSYDARTGTYLGYDGLRHYC